MRSAPLALPVAPRVLTSALVLALLGGTLAPLAVSANPPAGGPTRVRVAAISFVPTKLDVEGNAARLEAAFRRAAQGGAQLAVAPEGALDGYVINEVLAEKIPVVRMHDVALPLDHPIIRRFQSLAESLHLCLVFGFAERVGPDVFNTAVFIDTTGRILGRYHKMQFEEGYHPDWWFNRLGQESRAFDTPFGRCGILICNDRWNPALARIPALDGAQFLVIPAYGSTSTAQDAAVVARARENRLPIVEANVGVCLVVSEGAPAAVSRERETVLFSEIVVPPPLAARPGERDAVEREFLAWRAAEMPRRWEAKQQRLQAAGRPATGPAAAGPPPRQP